MGEYAEHSEAIRAFKVLKARLEARLKATLVRKWHLDATGSRFGWVSIHPCAERWEGASLFEVAERLARDDADRDSPESRAWNDAQAAAWKREENDR